MRPILCGVSLVLVLGGCVSSGSPSTRVGGRQTMRGAVVQPLEDFNLIREKIPASLRRAEEAPYAQPDPPTCMGIHFEISQLDEALGPDSDVQDPSPAGRTTQGAVLIGRSAVSAMQDLTTNWIPLRSWVRTMTGAQSHSAQVRKAVNAGLMRRAFLKGIAHSRDCPVTAAAAPAQFPAPPPTPSSAGG